MSKIQWRASGGTRAGSVPAALCAVLVAGALALVAVPMQAAPTQATEPGARCRDIGPAWARAIPSQPVDLSNCLRHGAAVDAATQRRYWQREAYRLQQQCIARAFDTVGLKYSPGKDLGMDVTSAYNLLDLALPAMQVLAGQSMALPEVQAQALSVISECTVDILESGFGPVDLPPELIRELRRLSKLPGAFFKPSEWAKELGNWIGRAEDYQPTAFRDIPFVTKYAYDPVQLARYESWLRGIVESCTARGQLDLSQSGDLRFAPSFSDDGLRQAELYVQAILKKHLQDAKQVDSFYRERFECLRRFGSHRAGDPVGHVWARRLGHQSFADLKLATAETSADRAADDLCAVMRRAADFDAMFRAARSKWQEAEKVRAEFYRVEAQTIAELKACREPFEQRDRLIELARDPCLGVSPQEVRRRLQPHRPPPREGTHEVQRLVYQIKAAQAECRGHRDGESVEEQLRVLEALLSTTRRSCPQDRQDDQDLLASLRRGAQDGFGDATGVLSAIRGDLGGLPEEALTLCAADASVFDERFAAAQQAINDLPAACQSSLGVAYGRIVAEVRSSLTTVTSQIGAGLGQAAPPTGQSPVDALAALEERQATAATCDELSAVRAEAEALDVPDRDGFGVRYRPFRDTERSVFVRYAECPGETAQLGDLGPRRDALLAAVEERLGQPFDGEEALRRAEALVDGCDVEALAEAMADATDAALPCFPEAARSVQERLAAVRESYTQLRADVEGYQRQLETARSDAQAAFERCDWGAIEIPVPRRECLVLRPGSLQDGIIEEIARLDADGEAIRRAEAALDDALRNPIALKDLCKLGGTEAALAARGAMSEADFLSRFVPECIRGSPAMQLYSDFLIALEEQEAAVEARRSDLHSRLLEARGLRATVRGWAGPATAEQQVELRSKLRRAQTLLDGILAEAEPEECFAELARNARAELEDPVGMPGPEGGPPIPVSVSMGDVAAGEQG